MTARGVSNYGFRVQGLKICRELPPHSVPHPCGMHTWPCPVRDRSSLILPEVDARAQVPGPSHWRGSGDGEARVFYLESGGGASWRGSGDKADNARVETEGQGPLKQHFEGDWGRGGLRPLAQCGVMAEEIGFAELMHGFFLADPAKKVVGDKSGAPGLHQVENRLSESPGRQQLRPQNAAVPSRPCPGGRGPGASQASG